MRCDLTKLRAEERIAAELSCLYTDRGYKEYKMSAFEEYSTYMDNKDFLISQNIVTFSGMDGRLMALRPDVTLSVVKNTKATYGRTEKLFYNEKVYRPERGSKTFKEVSQIGVEVIGDVDKTTEAEVVVLILKTLAAVGQNYVLDLSHMGYINALLDDFALNAEQKNALFGYLKEKNVHDFLKYAEEIGLDNKKRDIFKVGRFAVTRACKSGKTFRQRRNAKGGERAESLGFGVGKTRLLRSREHRFFHCQRGGLL